jgi:hypothetical protein
VGTGKCGKCLSPAVLPLDRTFLTTSALNSSVSLRQGPSALHAPARALHPRPSHHSPYREARGRAPHLPRPPRAAQRGLRHRRTREGCTGEVFGVQWRHVDLATRRIHVANLGPPAPKRRPQGRGTVEEVPEPPCKPGLIHGDLTVSADRAQACSASGILGGSARSPDHAKDALLSATREQNGIQSASAAPLPPVQGELFLRAGGMVAERCATLTSREAVLRRASRQAASLLDQQQLVHDAAKVPALTKDLRR